MSDTTPSPNLDPTSEVAVEVSYQNPVGEAHAAEIATSIADIAKEFKVTELEDSLVEPAPSQSDGVTTGEFAGAKIEPPVNKEDQVKELSPTQVAGDVVSQVFAKMEEARLARKAERAKEKAARKAQKQAERALKPKGPIKQLRAQGLDPDYVVRKVLAKKLEEQGTDIPVEMRAYIEDYERDARVRSLEERLAQKEREAQARQYHDWVSGQAKDYLSKADLAKDAPTVAEIYKRDPGRVHTEVMQEIIQDAQTRMGANPDGDILSYIEAAKRVEARWSDYKKFFSPGPSNGTGEASTSNQPQLQAQGTPPKPANKVVKPPDRPIAPWLRPNSEEEALRAAVAEYNKAELNALKS